MKNRKIYFIKLGTFLFGVVILSLTNCSKKESLTFENQQQNNIKTIGFDEFLVNINKEQTSFNYLQTFFDINDKTKKKNYYKNNSLSDITIITNNITSIREEKATFYTFKVITNNFNNVFYNLIISVDDKQNIIDSKFLEYTPSNTWLQNTTKPFSGHVKLIDNNFLSLENLFEAKGTKSCVVGVNYSWKCAAGNQHTPDDCGTKCEVCGSQYYIDVLYGSCNISITPDGSYPASEEAEDPNYNTGGGGSGSSTTIPTIPCEGDSYETDVNGYCFYDDKIDASQLTGKADCVYQKMVDGDNNINWILENFEDKNQPSEFNLKFEMSTSLSSLTNASTIKSGNTFIIKINQYRAENINTTLTIARTILHEGIHARLREFASRQGSNETSFPGVYDYFRRFEKNWDHQQMAAHYRSTIAQGLKQYDKGQHSDAFYDALAWEGLSEIKDLNGNQETIYTEAWKELSPSEQQKVLDIITEEKQNGNKTCQ